MVTTDNGIVYRGWVIHPLAIPNEDGNWLASCEIEKIGSPSVEEDQGAIGNVMRPSKKEAIEEICNNARREIDEISAVPCRIK